MSQKSILNYFNKVPKSTPSPTGNGTGTLSPEPTPPIPPTTFVTPKSSRTKTTPRTTPISGNKKELNHGKKRVRISPEHSPEPRSQSKRQRGTPGSPDLLTPMQKRPRRFRRILIQDDEEEDDEMDTTNEIDGDNEYKPENDLSMTSQDSTQSESEQSSSSPVISSEEEENNDCTPRSKRLKSTINARSKLSSKTPESIKSIRTPIQKGMASPFLQESPAPSPCGNGNAEGKKCWTYLTYSWLKDDKIMDKKKRRPDHPDYDHRTLFVPKEFLEKSTTPALRQWWEMKANHFDTLLFFKMGKFYELYHMDAVIAVQELGLIYMKGEHAHCGFPEIAYSQNAEILVGKGYKVARCEQTETPAMNAARNKGGGSKWDKVVRREICQVTTKGIRVASALDGRSMPFHQNSEYLYAIVERNLLNGGTGVEYGVCFVDTTIGTFFIGQFKDDRYSSRLRTLFSHHIPVQILYEKGKVNATLSTLMGNLSGVRKDALLPDMEFWSAQKTLKFLAEGKYFQDKKTGSVIWPETIQSFLSKTDALGLTPVDGSELGLMCLGAVVWFLKSCLVEHDLLTLRKFEIYSPIDLQPSLKPQNSGARSTNSFMILDGSTLRNLQVTDSAKCLLSFLDNCSTSFGKRLLRYWTCVPLGNPEEIKKRQDSIEELMEHDDLIARIVPQLKSLLDLERLLGKIHNFGSIHRNQEHPDSRASFFEEKKYSKRKITDLVSVLKNFKTCVNIINSIKSEVEFRSELLSSVISEFPLLTKLLKYFDEAFNHEKAMEAGNIEPVRGLDPEYDAAFQGVDWVMKQASEYLNEVRRDLGSPKVSYFGSDKKRFTLEMPESVRVGKEYDMAPSRKGFKRYTTKRTRALLEKLIEAEINREKVIKDITRRVFAQFDESRELWSKAIQCIAILDVLISLTKYSRSQDNMIRPIVVVSASPFMKIEDGRHPCLDPDKYIPNSCTLGHCIEGSRENGTFLLLTGANMGGKSTAMKQTGLIAILAHMGCYVPATSCAMSIIDRIFTRIGAADNIAEGESTFFVELSETSAILQHASQSSLVLMDELGRGTATYDGNAIAYSVADALSQRGPRTIFSTHYHSLVTALQDKPSVQVGHMACMVEHEGEDDDDPTQETITFLYKLTAGPCAKSYGFNAARLAGVPDDVIRVAHRKARELEMTTKKLALCRMLAGRVKACSLSVLDTKLITTECSRA